MRYRKLKGIALIGLVLSVMLFGASCDLNETAALATVDRIADELIEEGKTLYAPTDPSVLPTDSSVLPTDPSVLPTDPSVLLTDTPVLPRDTPVPPTDTPVPPTDTPVPPPTEVKVSMVDEEGDCDVKTGSIGDEGCPIDVQSFEVFPCENPGVYTFKVEFYALKDIMTTDVCFRVNADNDPATGFTDAKGSGVDWVYCWVGEMEEVFLNRFGPGGDYLDTIPVSNPYSYVVTDTGQIVATAPFVMFFPPEGVPDLVITSPFEVSLDSSYYTHAGDFILDRVGSIPVSACSGP